MTVKTTLSVTDRQHQYFKQRGGEGIYASTGSAVAAAVERMMQDEAARRPRSTRWRTRSAGGAAGYDETFATVRVRLGTD